MFLFVGGDDQFGLSDLRFDAVDFRLGLGKSPPPAVCLPLILQEGRGFLLSAPVPPNLGIIIH